MGPDYGDQYENVGADEPVCTQLEACSEEGEIVQPVLAAPGPEAPAAEAPAPVPPEAEGTSPEPLDGDDAASPVPPATPAPIAVSDSGADGPAVAVLPATGGVPVVLVSGAAALMLGGLLVRGFVR